MTDLDLWACLVTMFGSGALAGYALRDTRRWRRRKARERFDRRARAAGYDRTLN